MVLVAPRAHALTAHLSCWQQWNWFFANLVRLARRRRSAARRIRTDRTGNTDDRLLRAPILAGTTGADLSAALFLSP
jgi:hypothetical protein